MKSLLENIEETIDNMTHDIHSDWIEPAEKAKAQVELQLLLTVKVNLDLLNSSTGEIRSTFHNNKVGALNS